MLADRKRLGNQTLKKSEPALESDRRDSFTGIYLSLFPFVSLEFLVETRLEILPSGLIFPTGFLLFWAFFYTYYKPSSLEQQLSQLPNSTDFLALPAILLGLSIWFVKVTLQEMLKVLLMPFRSLSRPRPVSRPTNRVHFQSRENEPRPARAAEPPRRRLPNDVQLALQVLGIPQARRFSEIHARYRELAKKLHPDLNGDITKSGRRFIQMDQAYKKLKTVKALYFS